MKRRKLLTLGNDANVVYEYNINNWLTSIVNHINDVNVSFEYDKYDKVGNRKSCVIDNNSAAAYVFDYDEIYRLIFADYNDGNFVDYTYDALGNRDEVNDTGSVFDYDVSGASAAYAEIERLKNE